MINIDLLNTIDFDINVNEKFSYLYYNQNETVEEDTKIVNNKINPDRFIELKIDFGKKYDTRFDSYKNTLNLEEIKELSGKSLSDSDIEYFNKLDKRNNLINLSMDKSDESIVKINNYFGITNSDHNDAIDTIKKNNKISISRPYKEEFLNSNRKKIFFTKNISKSIENFVNYSSDYSLGSQYENSRVNIKKGFKEYRRVSTHTERLNDYYFIQIGHFIEKYKIINDSKILVDSVFYYSDEIENFSALGRESYFSGSLIIKDNAIQYGSTYSYMIYPTYITTQPCRNDYHLLSTFIICDYPYITKDITCKEFKRPISPSKLFFKYNEDKKELNIKWAKPLEIQGDVKGYQIFKRQSLQEPFTLIKQIEFHSPLDAYSRNLNVPSDLVEISQNHKNTCIDHNFNPGKIQIYAICSIDAHGYTSNYSQQIGVVYNASDKKCMTDLVSRSGAPLHMPNLLIPRKTRFFDNDDNIVTITPLEKNIEKITLYLTPEYKNISDVNEESFKTLNDKYKFSIYKLENGETFISDLEIKNFD